MEYPKGVRTRRSALEWMLRNCLTQVENTPIGQAAQALASAYDLRNRISDPGTPTPEPTQNPGDERIDATNSAPSEPLRSEGATNLQIRGQLIEYNSDSRLYTVSYVDRPPSGNPELGGRASMSFTHEQYENLKKQGILIRPVSAELMAVPESFSFEEGGNEPICSFISYIQNNLSGSCGPFTIAEIMAALSYRNNHQLLYRMGAPQEDNVEGWPLNPAWIPLLIFYKEPGLIQNGIGSIDPGKEYDMGKTDGYALNTCQWNFNQIAASPGTYWGRRPPDNQINNAKQHTISDWGVCAVGLWDQGIMFNHDEFKAAMLVHGPLELILPITNAASSRGEYLPDLDKSQTYIGNHSFVVTGWNKDGYICRSHIEGIGKNGEGTFIIRYDYFNNEILNWQSYIGIYLVANPTIYSSSYFPRISR